MWINGAGKTTTLEAIMWFLPISAWTITFFKTKKLDNTVRQRIGYAPDKTPYFEFLTWWENVMRIADYAGITSPQKESRWQELFDKLWLSYAKDNYVQNYSQGMKQRLWLILSLINNPDIVIWDEPMSGLDPLGRIIVKNLMKDLQQDGKTILFSTHILSDVQEIANRFGILDGWKIVYEGITKDISWNLESFFHTTILDGQELSEFKIQ